jgi:hypothetical protein
VYGSKVADFFVGKPAPKAAVDAAKNSLGGAYAVAHDLGRQAVPGAKAVAASLQSAANTAFVDAFHWGAVVGGVVLVLAVAIVVAFLPARAAAADEARPAPGGAPTGGPFPSPANAPAVTGDGVPVPGSDASDEPETEDVLT